MYSAIIYCYRSDSVHDWVLIYLLTVKTKHKYKCQGSRAHARLYTAQHGSKWQILGLSEYISDPIPTCESILDQTWTILDLRTFTPG